MCLGHYYLYQSKISAVKVLTHLIFGICVPKAVRILYMRENPNIMGINGVSQRWEKWEWPLKCYICAFVL